MVDMVAIVYWSGSWYRILDMSVSLDQSIVHFEVWVLSIVVLSPYMGRVGWICCFWVLGGSVG